MRTFETPAGPPGAARRGGHVALWSARAAVAALLMLIGGSADALDDGCDNFDGVQDISFGVVASGTHTPGTVTINPATGGVTTTGGVTFFGGNVEPARFAGRAHGTHQHCTITLLLPARVYLRGRGRTVSLTNFTLHPSSINLEKRRDFSFDVGATLNLPAGLPAGTYSGSITATAIFTGC